MMESKPGGQRRLIFWLTTAGTLLAIALPLTAIAVRHFLPRERGAARTVDNEMPPQSAALPADPASAPWESERWSSEAASQLIQLGDAIRESAAGTDLATMDWASRAFTFRAPAVTQVFQSSSVTISAAARPLASSETPQPAAAGNAAAFVQYLAQGLPSQGSEVSVALKIDRVELKAATVDTRIIFHASRLGSQGGVQRNGIWQAEWETSAGPPRLLAVEVLSSESAETHTTGNTLFTDCTESVFRNVGRFEKQLRPGVDHWRARLQAQYEIDPFGHHGIALADVNGDGLDDVYVCQPVGLPNLLFLQQADGTVREAGQEAGVDWLDRSRSASLLDFDNDGDQDLALVVDENVILLSNDGKGSFTEEASYLTGETGALAIADFDLDSDLDIYVLNYGAEFLAAGVNARESGLATPYPYHDANNGGANRMLRNDGEWKFVDVTDEIGLDQNNRRWSFAAAWEDYDQDGDPDLYVANDFGRNNLYRNDGKHFTDVAASAGVEDIAAGMSVSWGDANGDGWMDLYVGNMYSSAGGRIVPQTEFQSRAGNDLRDIYRRHARGNSLFLNTGEGTFLDVSENAGVTVGRWAWASKFVDINNDSLEDLVVANGFVTGPKVDDL